MLQAIKIIRNKRQLNSSDLRKRYLNNRNIKELMTMLLPKKPTEDELKGRFSGNLSWRMLRGEHNFNTVIILPFNNLLRNIF